MFRRDLPLVSTAAMVTWYPVDAAFRARNPEQSVAGDLALMVDALPGRTIHLTEVGYPSSASCAGGEAAQARFVRAFFAGWDRHADRITHAYWTWMTDVSDEVVKQARDYYGVAEPCFAEYIGTLGLETKDLEPKAGWAAFAEEAAKRFH
jgi:hypothetical protein